MSYVDGFLLAVPKKNLKAYASMSKRAGKVWRKLGAVEYRECALDDARAKGCVAFPKGAKAKNDETVIFSWIVYESKAQRTKILKSVMKDPGILAMVQSEACPYDPKRMMYGGFKIIVDM